MENMEDVDMVLIREQMKNAIHATILSSAHLGSAAISNQTSMKENKFDICGVKLIRQQFYVLSTVQD